MWMAGPETGYGLKPRLEGAVEAGQVGPKIGGAGGVETGQVAGDRLRHRRHRVRVVPKVRVRSAVGQPERLLDVDDLPLRVRRRGFDGAHEGVVSDAVLNDQLSGTQLGRHRRACFERVGISVGVAQDRGHLDVPATDLTDDVRILVLGSHGGDDTAALYARRARAGASEHCHGKAERHDLRPAATSQELKRHSRVTPRVTRRPPRGPPRAE